MVQPQQLVQCYGQHVLLNVSKSKCSDLTGTSEGSSTERAKHDSGRDLEIFQA